MERKCRQDTEENEALLEHEDVQDDEQPDDWWDKTTPKRLKG